MNSLNITVVSEKEDKRIPISVAADVMGHIQLILSDIGESLVAKEMRLYGRVPDELTERFTLYIDPNSGGITVSSSGSDDHMMDQAIDLLKKVIHNMGSGAGGYWMEDNFSDPRFRSTIILDLLDLSNCVHKESGFAIIYEIDGETKKFTPPDSERMIEYIKKNRNVSNGAICGILYSIASKSKGAPKIGMMVGNDKVKLLFNSNTSETKAMTHVGGPVIVAGRLKYSDSGELQEIANVDGVTEFDVMRFGNIISQTRTLTLNIPLEAEVSYKSETWKISYGPLGISVSKNDWDTASIAFHDYFAFLWDEYGLKEGLSGEEAEIKETLTSFISLS